MSDRFGVMNSKYRLVPLSVLVVFSAVILMVAAHMASDAHGDTVGSRTVSSTAAPSGPALVVVGDSLTFGAGWYIDHDLTVAGAAPPVQTAVIGYTTTQLAAAADQSVGASPTGGQFVFASGTNDVGYAADGGPPINVGLGHLDAVLGRAQAHGKCVITVGVTSHGTEPRERLAAEWNLRSAELATRHNGQFVDWDGLSRAHPEWFIDDGIHHTPAGRQAYADAIVAAAHACR